MTGIKTQTLRLVVAFVFIGMGGGLSGAGLLGFWGMFAVMMSPQAVFLLWDNRGCFRALVSRQT